MDGRRLEPFSRDPESQRRAWEAPRATTLVDLLAPAGFAPDLVALLFVDHADAPEPLSWGRLAAAARGRAADLAGAGVGEGDRVVLMLPTMPAFFEVYFGVLLLGAVPVPVAPPHTLRADRAAVHFDNVARIARDCGASTLVGLDRPLEALVRHPHAAGALRLVSASAPALHASISTRPAPAPGELALLQYTSGSTSHPKGVELTHANIVANIRAIVSAIVHETSTGVFWLPLHHDMGLIGGALTALYCRRPAVLMPPQAFAKSPARWLTHLSDVRATITVAPNFAFALSAAQVADEDLEGVDLSALEVALNGAEPVDLAAVQAFESRFAARGLKPGTVRPVYGLAESALAVTFGEPGPRQVDVVQADALERDGRAIPPQVAARTRSFVSVGRPLATQEVRIIGEAGTVLPDRTIGEIVVRGPSVMRGYYRRPEASAAALDGGWLHTGDLGYMTGGRLYITGRSKDLIKRLGRNYYAQDIEQIVAGVAGVLQGAVAAFGLETGEAVRIVVMAETRLRDPEALSDLRARIRERCQQQLDVGPDDVWLAAPGEIPRTTSGKVRRQACRERYVAISGRTPATPPSAATSTAGRSSS
jgi:acyl-CoA synthetase (AMP-forming)/AMP-acid ligase II